MGNIVSPTAVTLWTVSMQLQTQSTNFKVFFFMVVINAIPTDPKHILDWGIAALPTFISAPRKNFNSSMTKATTSSECGSVIGGKRKKKEKTSGTL